MKGKQESAVHTTDAVEDNGSPESNAAEVAEVLPTTENNCLKVFSMTEVEAFLVGKDPVDQQHTMVGSVSLSAQGLSIAALALFGN